jgi:hypothetical protein
VRARHWLLLAVVLLVSFPSSAADLNERTIDAWKEYICRAEARMHVRLIGSNNFLWMDEAAGRRDRVRQGEIVVEPATKDIPEKVPQGLIHDWIGVVFIPNTTMDTVFATLSDYDSYNKFYNPAVIDAKLREVTSSSRKFSLVLAEKVPFVTAAIASEYTSQTFRVDDHHRYTITYSTRIQQIDDYGKAGQHLLPPDHGAGYIWRLYSIERFEERDGGVYAELEAIALSRNIPFELQWLVRPILQHMPRNSMVGTLSKTRQAVFTSDSSNAPELAKLASPGAGSGKSGAAPKHGDSFRSPQSPAPRSMGVRSPD